MFSLIGSIKILGNPSSLLRSVKTGAVEFFQKPISGFIKGPLHLGYGMIEGTGSLIQHTSAGIFNSVGSISGTFASGLSSLSFDKDYIEKRKQKQMKKPNNVAEGVSQGLESVGKGFFKGVTGVLTKPLTGLANDGISGFFKGTL